MSYEHVAWLVKVIIAYSGDAAVNSSAWSP